MALKARALLVLSFPVVVALGLSGCVNWHERDAASCSSYGWTPGTPAFAQCMQDADMQRRPVAVSYPQAPVTVPVVQGTFYPIQTQQPMRLQTMCQQIGTMTFCN